MNQFVVEALPPTDGPVDGADHLPFEPAGTKSEENVKCRWCGELFPLWKISYDSASSLGKRLVDGYVLLRRHVEKEHHTEWAALQSAIHEYEHEAQLRGGIEGYIPAWYQLDSGHTPRKAAA